ncbi:MULTISPECIES: hypothetical protein [unclassified Pedobacter]|uniref:hypothetical protein n=1 Tax=unclassified Pedobacter TaxID=2628915 RepID=UPI001828B19D|nr:MULTISPECIES: hypothetical protein [unclassified Pedobacter]NII85866.1 hypothetical protein [Pedobacter sp. SG908]NMN39219.1 hypothetical protein [Pedobacter sp. SG918]
MRKISILVISVFLFLGCKQKSIVHPTFYYWKTDYQNKKEETSYLDQFKSKSLYVRIMDVDFNPDLQLPVPISPVKFSDPIPKQTGIIPVVFIVNQVFNKIDTTQTMVMADRIAKFVSAKVKQAGKQNYHELQIDCDWTKGTRNRYFKFLEQLKANPLLKGKTISVTLRLHQVKNIVSSGVPPVEKAILMCYNMGNLRKYGRQNSILDQHEMDLYLKDYLEQYPLPLDVALPIFEWAVVFRNGQYAGISKRIGNTQIADKKLFKQRENSILYDLLKDDPAAGLKQGDVVRWERISSKDLLATSKFLSRYLAPRDRNLVFYHLDTDLLKHFTYDDVQKIIANF